MENVLSPISAALKSVIFLRPHSSLYASRNLGSDNDVCKKGAPVFLSGFLQVPPMHTGRKGWSQISSALQFLSCRPWLSPNVEGEVPSAHVSCDQNIRLDPQYTAKSVMCTKTRVEGKRGGRPMGDGRRKGPRTPTEADLAGRP